MTLPATLNGGSFFLGLPGENSAAFRKGAIPPPQITWNLPFSPQPHGRRFCARLLAPLPAFPSLLRLPCLTRKAGSRESPSEDRLSRDGSPPSHPPISLSQRPGIAASGVKRPLLDSLPTNAQEEPCSRPASPPMPHQMPIGGGGLTWLEGIGNPHRQEDLLLCWISSKESLVFCFVFSALRKRKWKEQGKKTPGKCV